MVQDCGRDTGRDSFRVKAGCPSENDILARVSGALPPDDAAKLDAHVDGCAECRVLLAEAANWLDESSARSGSARTFAPGDVVENRYVIERMVAAGGMGEVYEAYDKLLDEHIALKTLSSLIADDERALARLHQEARLSRRVTHENVCRVYDMGVHQRRDERITFFTMELVPGITLRRHLRDNGRFTLEAALPLITQMVAALRHSHSVGIVHRDFKSDNVLLEPPKDGMPTRLVVTDFGLARQWLIGDGSQVTPRSRQVLGTLDYMAPEQIMGKEVTPGTDVYALGIVIYEMLTGELPFQGDSPLARAVIRVTQSAPRLDATLPAADPRATACIARCLETNPERRFDSVDAVLKALREAPPARLSVSPRGKVGWGVAILGVVGLAGLVYSLRVSHPDAKEPMHAAPEPRSSSKEEVTTAPLVMPAMASVAAPARTTPSSSPRGAAASDTARRHSPEHAVRVQTVARRKPGPSVESAADEQPAPPPTGDALLMPFVQRKPAANVKVMPATSSAGENALGRQ